MKTLLVILLVLLVLLQFKLWFGDGGILEVRELRRAIALQEAENGRLRGRNQALDAEVGDLKTGLDALEERARSDLGMIREGETFFRIIEPQTGDQ